MLLYGEFVIHAAKIRNVAPVESKKKQSKTSLPPKNIAPVKITVAKNEITRKI